VHGINNLTALNVDCILVNSTYNVEL